MWKVAGWLRNVLVRCRARPRATILFLVLLGFIAVALYPTWLYTVQTPGTKRAVYKAERGWLVCRPQPPERYTRDSHIVVRRAWALKGTCGVCLDWHRLFLEWALIGAGASACYLATIIIFREREAGDR